MSKKTGLGQGVSLLFGGDEEKYFECDVEKIIPNKHQPRTIFKDESLLELAQSIKENGIIQPLIVSGSNENGKYELIAGERRLRASKEIGLKQVPVVVLEVKNEDSLLELALIENVQRTDLNPIEEAEAFRKLIEKFGYTQEQTASRVGKKRSTITNSLRLLKLPESIKNDISSGLLSEGHGRALVKLSDEPIKIEEIRDIIIKENLSVRQTEKIVKKISLSKPPIKRKVTDNDEEIPISYRKALTTQLTNKLNTKVNISLNGSRGKIEIDYYSMDDLDRVMALLVTE